MFQIKNSIIIQQNIVEVFMTTNNVANWPDLFSEYKAVEIIEQSDHYVKFRLTTFPHEGHDGHSWISERHTDADRYEVRGRRIEQSSPFSVMEIFWKYEPVDDKSCKMTWVQEFELCIDASHSNTQVKNYLNSNSRKQMKLIKQKLEKR